LPAIAMRLAEAESNENLKSAVFKVTFEGNESAGAAFFDLSHEAHDFGMMQKEFARTIRFGVGPVAVAVWGDVKGVEPSFTVFDPTVGVSEVTPAGADGFDFRAGQDDAGFDRFGNGVVMSRLAVMDFDRFQGA